MLRALKIPRGEWFGLNIAAEDGETEAFCQVLHRNGHDVHRARSDEGEFVAAYIRPPERQSPYGELEHLLRAAGLSAHILRLPMSSFHGRPAQDIELLHRYIGQGASSWRC